MTVRMDDGTEENFDPGDVMIVTPGHDAWTVGPDACVVLDWEGYANYAKPRRRWTPARRGTPAAACPSGAAATSGWWDVAGGGVPPLLRQDLALRASRCA